MPQDENKLAFVPKAFTQKFVGTGVYRQFYNSVITDKRIIAGRTGIDWIKGLSRALQDERKYSDLEPEQIVQADKHNFAFYFTDLIELELRKFPLGGAHMTLRSRSGGSKKIFFDKKHYPEVVKVLKGVAGEILKGA